MKTETGRPRFDGGAIRKQSPREYLVRFAFGAVISAGAAAVAIAFGARIGGILLAFPAILPASLTLIERKSGRKEAVVDSTGAAMGGAALVVFAIVAAWGLPRMNAVAALVLAGLSWVVSVLVLFGAYVVVVRLRRRKTAK
ncbi:MAG: DUF3147 family protein [Chloroflexi bacterium]|nr:MAG: DUF3147 family protein [Chloroflexota bacterium]